MVKVTINNLPAQDLNIMGLIPLSDKGQPGGVAELGADGKVLTEQLPPGGGGLPTLEEMGAEPVGAEIRSRQYTDEKVGAIQIPPLPTLADLGGEPAGAESRSRQYTDEKFGTITFPAPPAPPTLASLGAEPAGAELRSRQYTDEKIGGIAFPAPPTLASLGAEPVGAEARARQYVDQRFPPVTAPTTEFRINCGSSLSYVDAAGKTWAPDNYFEFGSADNTSYTGIVGATYDFLLFNSSRSGGGGGFNYKIPIPNGNYKIELGFSENWHNTVNSRKFNVFIEGLQVLTGFDIRAQAGMRYSAIKRIFNSTVSDGVLNLQFVPTLDGAQINNIYICSI